MSGCSALHEGFGERELDWQPASQPVNWSVVGRSADRPVGPWPVGWPAGRQASWSVGQPVDWLVIQPAGPSVRPSARPPVGPTVRPGDRQPACKPVHPSTRQPLSQSFGSVGRAGGHACRKEGMRACKHACRQAGRQAGGLVQSISLSVSEPFNGSRHGPVGESASRSAGHPRCRRGDAVSPPKRLGTSSVQGTMGGEVHESAGRGTVAALKTAAMRGQEQAKNLAG